MAREGLSRGYPASSAALRSHKLAHRKHHFSSPAPFALQFIARQAKAPAARIIDPGECATALLATVDRETLPSTPIRWRAGTEDLLTHVWGIQMRSAQGGSHLLNGSESGDMRNVVHGCAAVLWRAFQK